MLRWGNDLEAGVSGRIMVSSPLLPRGGTVEERAIGRGLPHKGSGDGGGGAGCSSAAEGEGEEEGGGRRWRCRIQRGGFLGML